METRTIENNDPAMHKSEVVTYSQILKAMANHMKPNKDASFCDINKPNCLMLQLVIDVIKNNSKHFRIEEYTV